MEAVQKGERKMSVGIKDFVFLVRTFYRLRFERCSVLPGLVKISADQWGGIKMKLRKLRDHDWSLINGVASR